MTAVWPGTAYPLGATYDGSGTNFALVSEIADARELCRFGDDGTGTGARRKGGAESDRPGDRGHSGAGAG